MKIEISKENLETLLEGAVFASSCDVTAEGSLEWSEALLKIGKDLKDQAASLNIKVFDVPSTNVELFDTFEGKPTILEMPELAQGVRAILE